MRCRIYNISKEFLVPNLYIYIGQLILVNKYKHFKMSAPIKQHNSDTRNFTVSIRNKACATKLLKKYKLFVKFKTEGTGEYRLTIDFTGYGNLDSREKIEFNSLRKQSIVSTPENYIQEETNRFNKRRWKRKYDSRLKSESKESRKVENTDRFPNPTQVHWNNQNVDVTSGFVVNNKVNSVYTESYLPHSFPQYHFIPPRERAVEMPVLHGTQDLCMYRYCGGFADHNLFDLFPSVGPYNSRWSNLIQ